MTLFPIAILGASLLGAGPLAEGVADGVAPPAQTAAVDAYAANPQQPCQCPACQAAAGCPDDGWTYGTVYPDTYAADQNCCWCCCCLSCCRGENLLGPGDLHPHYAYCPAYHGYYYFRPYNHMHVLYDAATVAAWGGDPRAPYSVEFLRPLFVAAGPDPRGFVPAPFADDLPILEDLLPGGRPIEIHPPLERAPLPGIEVPEPSIHPTSFDRFLGPRL
jgi:hypothetical protein